MSHLILDIYASIISYKSILFYFFNNVCPFHFMCPFIYSICQALSGILKQLDASVGRPLVSTSSQATRAPEEALGYVH